MQAADQLHAVQAGQLQVRDHGIERTLFGLAEGVVAPGNHADVVAFVGQDAAQGGGGAGVVFDQEEFGRGTHFGSNLGNTMAKVVPWFNRVWNRSAPPCFSTIRAAMASPSPVPPSLVLKNGSNRRRSTSGGMPLPVSSTSRMTAGSGCPFNRSVAARVRSVMVPLRPMLSAAF